MIRKIINISDKMQNTTTYQIFTVSKCRKRIICINKQELESSKIFDIIRRIILEVSIMVRHFDTVVFGMGVVFLSFLKQGFEKLLITSDREREA